MKAGGWKYSYNEKLWPNYGFCEELLWELNAVLFPIPSLSQPPTPKLTFPSVQKPRNGGKGIYCSLSVLIPPLKSRLKHPFDQNFLAQTESILLSLIREEKSRGLSASRLQLHSLSIDHCTPPPSRSLPLAPKIDPAALSCHCYIPNALTAIGGW